MFPLKQEFAKRGEKQEKKKIAVKVKIFLKITHAHELVLGVPGCGEYWQKAEESEEECKKGTWYPEEAKKYKLLESKVKRNEWARGHKWLATMKKSARRALSTQGEPRNTIFWKARGNKMSWPGAESGGLPQTQRKVPGRHLAPKGSQETQVFCEVR